MRLHKFFFLSYYSFVLSNEVLIICCKIDGFIEIMNMKEVKCFYSTCIERIEINSQMHLNFWGEMNKECFVILLDLDPSCRQNY